MEYDPSEVICICSECGTEVPMRKAERSPFLAEGKVHPCNACGGVCILVERKDAANAIQQTKRLRGI